MPWCVDTGKHVPLFFMAKTLLSIVIQCTKYYLSYSLVLKHGEILKKDVNSFDVFNIPHRYSQLKLVMEYKLSY